MALGFVFGALNSFFVGGPVASFTAMIIGGVFSWWYLTAWACLFRSRKVEVGPVPVSPSA